MNSNPKTVTAAHTVKNKMENLRNTLQEASGELSKEEQEKGQLIERRQSIKKLLRMRGRFSRRVWS